MFLCPALFRFTVLDILPDSMFFCRQMGNMKVLEKQRVSQQKSQGREKREDKKEKRPQRVELQRENSETQRGDDWLIDPFDDS